MATGSLETGVPVLLSATGNIKSSQGQLLGIFVSASTSGTITIYDSATTTTTTKIVDTFTGVAGTWHRIPIAFANGCYVVVGGTLSATLVYA